MKRLLLLYIAVMCLVGFTSCLQDDECFSTQQQLSNEFTLTMQSNRLLPKVVEARAADPKSDLEKKINHLYIFFFDSDGNYLENYEQAGKVRFRAYQETSESMVKVDKSAIQEVDKNASVQVFALANMNGYGLFDTKDSYGRADLSGGTSNLAVLQQKVLSISNLESTSLGIPNAGMPMIGNVEIDFSNTSEKGVTLELSALMARVDFSIKLDAEHANGNLPMLYLKSYTVGNVPNKTSMGTSDITDMSTMGTNSVTIENHAMIYNKSGEISFTFYMFENKQGTVTYNKYPTSSNAADKPKYKPLLAENKPAAYVDLNTVYTTYDGIDNSIVYRLYLGANHTDNFDVKRNHQYKNDITVKGITNHNIEVDGQPGVDYLTYDARVTVSNSDYYVAILNEKALDAHFNVLPMDVYFLGDYKTSASKMVVTLGDDTNSCYYENSSGVMTQHYEPWIRMEKIPSANMEAGTLPSTMTEHVSTGKFKAYHGIRKFFTEDLVTNTLNTDIGKEVAIDTSRDRIYFYIDENLGENERIGTITLKFYADGNTSGDPTRTEVMKFKQLPLLKVEFLESHFGTGNNYEDDNFSDVPDNTKVFWMEQIEEYLDSYDPLEEYGNNNIFQGLEWGFNEKGIGALRNYGNSYNNYYYGVEYTAHMMKSFDYNMDNLYLSEKPDIAVQYCYNRNKRTTNYSVDPNVSTGTSWGQTTISGITAKWFMPGIRQMEIALERYFNNFSEFQDNYYWSSSAGFKTGFLGTRSEYDTKARTVKISMQGVHAESGNDSEGAKLRTDDSVRLRAFRIDRKKR